jgi:plasmid stabilization system protein ParE
LTLILIRKAVSLSMRKSLPRPSQNATNRVLIHRRTKMQRWKRSWTRMSVGLLAIAGLFAGAAGAQPQPRVDAVKQYLSLSDTQVQALVNNREMGHKEAQPIADQIKTKARTLADHRRNGTGDAQTLGQLMVEIREQRKTLQPLLARVHDQALAILTPDQRAKLTALLDSQGRRPELRQAARLGLLDRSQIRDQLQTGRQRRAR